MSFLIKPANIEVKRFFFLLTGKELRICPLTQLNVLWNGEEYKRKERRMEKQYKSRFLNLNVKLNLY